MINICAAPSKFYKRFSRFSNTNKISTMTIPNFFVIGAGKSGTTSVYYYLEQHPQVYVSPIKETNFFAYDKDVADRDKPGAYPVKTADEYRSLFDNVSTESMVGEVSPSYLSNFKAAGRAHHFAPHAKLIAILRNPVDRAYSSYSMMVRDGREPRSFEQAITEEEAGIDSRECNWGKSNYLSEGFYAKQLAHYYQCFDHDQLAVYLFDDLETDSNELMRKIYRHLGVDDTFEADTSVRYNASGSPALKMLRPFLNKTSVTKKLQTILPDGISQRALAWRSKQLTKPPLSQDMKNKLLDLYKPNIIELQKLLGRDLSHWLS